MENLLEIRLLGNLTIQEQGPVTLTYAKSQALLAYLAVTGRAYARLQIAELLWPEMEESSALGNLRQIVGDLRARLGRHLRIERQSLAFDFATPHWLDVAFFEQKTGDQSLEALQEAAALYRGDFLDGLYVNDAPQFESWMAGQRDRLRRLALRGLDDLTRRLRSQGIQGRSQALRYTERILEIEPWQEEAHRQMMLLLALDGQRSSALAQFDICRRVLAEELDVEPTAETLALYEQIRSDNLHIDPLDQSVVGGISVIHSTEQAPAGLPPFLAEEEGEEQSRESDFVAREQELQELDRFLSTALEGRGRCVFVTGDAGSGKTHLTEEFARRARQKHPRLVVVSGRCNAFSGIGDPYLPFREILESLTGDIESRWAAGRLDSTAARRLWQMLPQVYAELFTSAPDLIDLLVPSASLLQRLRAMGDPSDPWIAQARSRLAQMTERPGARQLTQLGVFSQFAALLQGLARGQPLLLILDDLQWIDASSASLLFHLGRQMEHSPILLVGTYREDELPLGRNGERHPLEAVVGELRRLYGNIQIDLNQTDAQKFMDALFAGFPNRLDAEFKESLYQHTKGHALFAIEMLHDMQERQALVKDGDGFWIQEGTTDWHSLPERVEAVIEERIGRLPQAHRETLKVASVEGEDFTAEVIARVQSMEEQRLVRLLSGELDRQYRLVRGQQSLRLGRQRLSQYEFRHILFSHYLYGAIDEIERSYLHEAVGDALEFLYGDRAETIAIRLAYHYSRSETWDKAIHYLTIAGDIAAAVYADKDALDSYTQALEMCDHLGRDYWQIASEIFYRKALVNLWSVDFDKILEIARNLQDRRLEGRGLALRGLYEFFMHQEEKSEATLRAALEAAGEEHKDVFVMARSILGNLLANFGRHQEAKQVTDIPDDILLAVDDTFVRSWWATSSMLIPNWEGRYDDALAGFQRWNMEEKRVSVVYYNAHWMRGLILAGKGDYHQAIELLEELEIKERRNYGRATPYIHNSLGWIYSEIQDHQRALRLNMQAIITCEEMELVGAEQEVNSRLNLGDNLFALGRLEDAAVQFQQVEQVVRNPSPEAHWMLWRYSQHLFHSYGELLLHTGETEKSLAYADECLALAVKMNSRKNIVKARRLRSQAFLTQGLVDLAEGEIQQACALSLEVGNPVQSWRSHAHWGKLLLAQKRKEEAESAYETARRVIESVAANLRRESMRRTFLDSSEVKGVQAAWAKAAT